MQVARRAEPRADPVGMTRSRLSQDARRLEWSRGARVNSGGLAAMGQSFLADHEEGDAGRLQIR